MMYVNRLLLCMMAVVFCAVPVHAQYSLSGWVDQALYYDNNDAGANNKFGYQMAQVGLRMSHAIDDNYGGYVQLTGTWSPGDTLAIEAREAYAYIVNDAETFGVKLGKWYAPIGFELADPVDLYQYSNSLVFTNLIPTELVGAIAKYQINDMLDLHVYLSGPWDNDAFAATDLGTLNIGGRLGIAIGDSGGVGISAVGGAQSPANTGLQRTAIDIDAAFTFGSLLVGGEFNINMFEQADGAGDTEVVTPMGILLMGNYGINDWISVTLRYDMVIDGDGDGGSPILGVDSNGDPLSRSSVTVAPLWNFADGFDLVTEVRYDMSSDDTFLVDGEATSGFLSAAAELIYQF